MTSSPSQVSLVDPDMATTRTLLLERDDDAGALLWSRVVDYPEVGSWAQSDSGPLHVNDDAPSSLPFGSRSDALFQVVVVVRYDGTDELRSASAIRYDDDGQLVCQQSLELPKTDYASDFAVVDDERLLLVADGQLLVLGSP